MWCSAADTHRQLLDLIVSGASFWTGSVFECDLAHHRSVAVLCMLYKVRCNPLHPLYGALPVQFVLGWLHTAVWSRIGTPMRLLAAEPRRIARLLFPCQYLCGTILVIPYWILWDFRVSRAGPMPFHRHSCSLIFCLLLFSLSLLWFYGLVSWGWGLRTERVLIALSLPCIAYLY